MRKRPTGVLLMLGVLALGAGPQPLLPPIVFPGEIAVDLHGPNARHESTSHRFVEPVTFRRTRLKVTVKVPQAFIKRPFSAIQLWAKDAGGRWQNTAWGDGTLSPENPMFDAHTGTLALHYAPTPMEISRQGWTQFGFHPDTGIREVGIKIGTPSAAAETYALTGIVQVLSVAAEPMEEPSPQEPAIISPVLRREAGLPNGAPHPLAPRDVKSGVSRYVVYGDLHRWNEVKDQVTEVFSAQQAQGLSAFRLMGGLDTRRQTGGIRLGQPELDALAAYLESARAAGQRWHIITLFDGAVPNDTLQEAMRDPPARKTLIDAYRPLMKRFGRAAIEREPVIFDLVNEIHQLGGVTERQRQQFVEVLIDAFIREAPGATLTLGLSDYYDLAYWLYLFPKYAQQPVRLIVTFHRYEPFKDLPAAWELNVPEGIEIGITEADPRRDLSLQIASAAAKGYRWLLCWQDHDYPYDPIAHRQAIERAAANAQAGTPVP